MATLTKIPTFEAVRDMAMSTFCKKFGGTPPNVACCAPGRVNLIGEHIDYNDGFVLPMALPMVTVIVGGPRTGNAAEIVTCCVGCDEPSCIEFPLQNLQPGIPKWANYVKGVIHHFAAELKLEGQLRGFNAVIASNVPVGAGLSSSAAIEVATLAFLENFTGKKLVSNDKRALVCQAAEHNFAGMPCGIMDQMISVSAQKDHALLLDCRSLETQQIPFAGSAKGLVVLICNSAVRHELSQSEYPTRRKQCNQALQLMALKSYRDATEANLSALKSADPVLLRRARHVITETKRTSEAANALKQSDFAKMGTLMTQSHTSLRDDFEVSCRELDVLVDAAINCTGVLGSRMTGGGFGGCTVTLLQRDAVDKAISAMRANFTKEFDKTAAECLEFYICTPGTGARRLDL